MYSDSDSDSGSQRLVCIRQFLADMQSDICITMGLHALHKLAIRLARLDLKCWLHSNSALQIMPQLTYYIQLCLCMPSICLHHLPRLDITSKIWR